MYLLFENPLTIITQVNRTTKYAARMQNSFEIADKGALNNRVSFNASEPKINGLNSAIDLIADGKVSKGKIVFEKNNIMDANVITARFEVSPDLNK